MKAKKLLSAVIAGTMALTTVSFSAFAENEVAQIGETKYETLAAAVAAATTGDTITLLNDASGDGIIIPSGSDLTIDLGGYTYTVSGDKVGSSGTETNGFQLLKDSNITFKNGTVTSTSATCKMLIQNYSNLTLEDIKLDGSNVVAGNYTLSNNNGNTVLKGNTNVIAPTNGCAFDVYNWKPSYPSVSVTLDETMTGTISGRIEFATVDAESNPETHKLVINGGTFTSENVTVYTDDYATTATKPISDFIGNSELSLIDNGDGTYTVAEAADSSVAQISDTKYETLAAAVEAAQSGETVTLLCNASGNGVKIPSGSNITIDFNGFTYNVDGTTVGSSGTETEAFQLLKDSIITFKNGTVTSTSATCKMLIQNYSNLTLEDMTLDGTNLINASWGYSYVLSNNCGNTVLKGNTNIITKDGDVAFDSCKFGNYTIPTVTVETTGTISGKIEMTGGNLFVKSGTFTVDLSEYCAAGYASITNNNGTYSVKAIASAEVAPSKIPVSNELLTDNGYTVRENTFARGEQITMPSVSGNTLNATYVFTKKADSTTKDYTFAFDISKLDIASANLGILIYNIPETYTVADPIITID